MYIQWYLSSDTAQNLTVEYCRTTTNHWKWNCTQAYTMCHNMAVVNTVKIL